MKLQLRNHPYRWGSKSVLAAAAWMCVAAFSPRAQAALTPTYLSGAVSGSHDVDNGTALPATTNSGMGTVPATAALLAPFNGAGNLLTESDGNSRGKGGAGHSEGSNLAKITFPTGMGVSQTDPGADDVGLSVYTMNFDLRWKLLPVNGTFGPTSGTFSVPVAATVGSGANATAIFEYEIHWDLSTNGGASFPTQLRSPAAGSQVFPKNATTLVTISNSQSIGPIVPSTANYVIRMSGFTRFIANNDGSPSAVEFVGPNETLNGQAKEFPADMSDIILNSPATVDSDNFQTQWLNQTNDQYKFVPFAGFEEPINTPEPSSMLLLGAGTVLLLRRTRTRHDLN